MLVDVAEEDVDEVSDSVFDSAVDPLWMNPFNTALSDSDMLLLKSYSLIFALIAEAAPTVGVGIAELDFNCKKDPCLPSTIFT